MTLITTITYVIEQTFDNDDIEETIKQDKEDFTWQEIIDELDNKLDNNGYISNWSRDSVKMDWED